MEILNQPPAEPLELRAGGDVVNLLEAKTIVGRDEMGNGKGRQEQR